MQNLTIAQTLTMSSLEIAQLVGSRHGDVKRSIERLAASTVIQLPPMAKVENKQSNSPNRFSEAYIFEGEQGKRDSIIVVAQLCPEFTARLVDRWQELEKLVSQPALPENYISALEALLESKKSEAMLALVNKKQEEEIHCLQNLFQTGMTPVQFCKQLNGVNIMGVNLFLAERNFLYDGQQEENKPYEWRVKAYARDKYFTEMVVTVNTEKGKKKFYEVILLKEGAKWLYRHYLKKELPMKKSWNGEFTYDKYLQVA
ncbi:hypothetical protein SODG_000541 [Sodalis praecaptivus]